MNPDFCERESQVVAAIRNGLEDPEILSHARACPICSEVLLVSAFLAECAVLSDPECASLPDPALIWRKAQALARQKALAKATGPIRLITSFACLVAACAIGWVAFVIRPLRWWPDLPRKYFDYVDGLWPSVLNESALVLGFGGTLILLALSSWYMLREN